MEVKTVEEHDSRNKLGMRERLMYLKATMGVLAITAGLGVTFLSSARSEQDVPPAKDAKKDTADEKTIRGLIAELSAESFDKREIAQMGRRGYHCSTSPPVCGS